MHGWQPAILFERRSQVSHMFTPIMSLAHFLLRLNVKMGGINTIPDPRSVSVISDPGNPTIVMGMLYQLSKLWDDI